MEVRCPYCGQTMQVDPPAPTSWSFVATSSLREVAALPYTRDIGKFDGRGWSQIGRDFFPKLGWEYYGILRLVPGASRILYQVGECRHCHHLFDLFANYGDRTLSELWPHLFASRSTAPSEDDIVPYQARTPTERFLEALDLARNRFVTALLLFLILAVALHLPTWLVRPPTTAQIVLVLMGVVYTAVAVTLMLNLIAHVRTDRGFRDLFQVREPRGVTYWRNYTLCRYVGVRLPPKQAASGVDDTVAPRRRALLLSPSRWVSQVALIGGGPAVLTLLLTWGVFQVISGASLPVILGKAGEVAWWCIVAYYTGVTTGVSLSSSVYVLAGVQRIPLRISPLDGFAGLRPLERVGTAVLSMLVAETLFILGFQAWFTLVPAEVSRPQEWLLWWSGLGVVTLLVFLTIVVSADPVAFRNRTILVVGAAYVVAFFYLSIRPVSIPLGSLGGSFSLRWLLVALFLSYLLTFAWSWAFNILRAIRRTHKEGLLATMRRQLRYLAGELEEFTEQLPPAVFPATRRSPLLVDVDDGQAYESTSQPGRLAALHRSLAAVQETYERVQKVPEGYFSRRLLVSVGPIAISFIVSFVSQLIANILS